MPIIKSILQKMVWPISSKINNKTNTTLKYIITKLKDNPHKKEGL